MNRIVLFSTVLSLFTAVSTFSVNGMKNEQYSTNSNDGYGALLDSVRDKVIKFSMDGEDVLARLNLSIKKYDIIKKHDKVNILVGTYEEMCGSTATGISINEIEKSSRDKKGSINKK